MRMTFAALAKSLGHAFTSSSSTSSVASSAGNQPRTQAPRTPPHNEKSQGEETPPGSLGEQEPRDAKEDARQESEAIAEPAKDNVVTRPDAEPTQESVAVAEDEEDMDIASSRASSPAPIISRDSLGTSVSGETPQTPPATETGQVAVAATEPPRDEALRSGARAVDIPPKLIEPVLNRKSESG